MPTVLCTSLNAEEGPHLDLLRDAGFSVSVVDRSLNLFDEDTLISQLPGVFGIVAGSEIYTPRVLNTTDELKIIARTGVGYDAIDLPTCEANDIRVTVTPGVNHDAVAEHTLALLLGTARGFPEQDARVREHRWQRIATPRVQGQTLGLIGLGRIGQAVAWRARGIGLNVIADEPAPDHAFIQQHEIELVSREELFRRADFVSLHCPATPENHRLINADTLRQMKPTAIVINTARGALVDENALANALREGVLRAAGLDVFDTEPLPEGSPLLNLPNILLSGHVAGLDEESHVGSFRMAAEAIIARHRGEPIDVGVIV